MKEKKRSSFNLLGGAGVFAVALATLPATSAVAAMPEVDVSGKSRLRYEDTQGYGTAASATTFQRAAFWSVRVRPSVTFKVDEHASIVAEPQFAKVLGRDYSYAATDSSGQTTYNEHFHMHQGYLNLKFSDEFHVKGGRMALDYGSANIIGVADWGVFGRTFDGVVLGYKNDLVKVDLGHVKLDSTANTIDSDKELAYLYSSWSFAEALKNFEVYGLYESNRVAGSNENRNAIGSRIKAKFSDLDVGAEYAMQKGSQSYLPTDQTGSMLVAEIGYTFQELAKLRVGVEFDQANEHWREWYPTTKSALGRNDIVGRRNLTALALRTKANVAEKLSVNLDYWMFTRTSTSATPFRTSDTIAVGATAASSSQDIGNSLELSVKYELSDKVEYGIGGAMFTQGSYLKENFGDRVMTDFYAMVNVEF